MDETQAFQSIPGTIAWKLHFTSSPPQVYQALATSEGRRKYWAESVEETNGELHYVFANGIENKGKILDAEPDRRFRVMYFGWEVTFDLNPDDSGGTDLSMTCTGVTDEDKTQIIAGWVSWLMAMKAAVDFEVDLRNHDSERTWFQGYVDN